MLKLINSDERWVRVTTMFVSVVAGVAIWEIVGWQFNPAFMVPLIGHDGFGGVVPRAYEFLLGVPLLAAGEEHGGALPRLYVYLFDDEEFRDAVLGSAKLFGTGFTLGVVAAVPLGILIPPDGKHAYIANTQADVVAVIDLESLEVVGSIVAGREPDGMAWSKLDLRSLGEDAKDSGASGAGF